MKLLILDLDGTITKSDSFIGFSVFMLLKKKKKRFIFIYPLYILLRLNIIDNIKFKIIYTYIILKNLNSDYLNVCAKEYVQSAVFQNDLNTDVLDYILKQSNSRKIILSANFDFITQSVAKSLSIEDSMSLSPEKADGKYTGKITGIIPFGKLKIEAFKILVSSMKYEKAIGLGDSESDLPFLKYLDEGILVKYDKHTNKTTFSQV